MKKLVIIALAAGAAISAGAAQAGEAAATGAVSGAVTGAIVGGPIGAAVGGVGGAVLGTALEPPPATVRTYVTEQRVPSVRVQEEVVVGKAVPGTVQYRVVPSDERYAYAVVNDHRVIIDPKTRVVVQVLD